MRRRDHFYNAGVGALAGGGRRAHLEGLARVDRAAARRLAGEPRHRDGFSRDSELVERRAWTYDLSIDRDNLARAHNDPISDGDLINWDVFERSSCFAMRHARRAIDKRLQIPFGASDRKILQHVAAGIHDGDDHAGQCLAERQRGGHRYERDRIDAHSSRQNVASDRDRETRDHRNCACRPYPPRKPVVSRESGGKSGGKPYQRDDD